jgi:hypothetical protein
MQIEIFTLGYLKFIFSSIWTFLGFLIILSVITGDFKKLLGKAKFFFGRINFAYKAILKKEPKQK